MVYCAGLYYRFSGGRQRTTKEYLMADGQMSVLPVAFSLMASFMSAITLLGVTQVSSRPSIKHHPAEVSLVLDNWGPHKSVTQCVVSLLTISIYLQENYNYRTQFERKTYLIFSGLTSSAITTTGRNLTKSYLCD
jgi:hypothetical protein